MSSFDERSKSFEKKFANDQEFQFKLTGRRNKYFGDWAAAKLNKQGQEIEAYVNEIIKAHLKKPGDTDLIGKVLEDFKKFSINISEEEVKNKLNECLEKAKVDFQ
tara:strand:+ start:585 stop:899 length:315 start_codon:yes stop_codon:yes gene_type:complete